MSIPDAVDWFDRPHQILNLCYNALDRHVIRGRGDDPALVTVPITGDRRSYSYAELLERVAQLAGGLRELGVEVGDRVLLFLPAVPEAAMAMLACARVGAVHVVAPPDSQPAQLITLIDDHQPAVIVSASCVVTGEDIIALKPLLDEALAHAVHHPNWCVIFQRPQVTASLQAEREMDFKMIMRPGAFEPAVPAELAADTPLYLLDGESGRSEGRQGPATVAWTSALTRDGFGPGSTISAGGGLATPTGHALLYGALLVGATVELHEDVAAPPDASAAKCVDNVPTTPGLT